MFLALGGNFPEGVCWSCVTTSACILISLRAGTGYSLVLHESKGTQDFTQSLIFETEGYLNTWKHFLGMLRRSSEIFFFSLGGWEREVCLFGSYLLGF